MVWHILPTVFSEARILHYPDWLCLPPIMMVAGKGPRLLCSRHLFLKEGDLRSLEFRDVENNFVRENCVPSWPVPLPLVHPIDDSSYGMRPHDLPRLVTQE
jgi:hypothetical protein